LTVGGSGRCPGPGGGDSAESLTGFGVDDEEEPEGNHHEGTEPLSNVHVNLPWHGSKALVAKTIRPGT